MDLGNRRIVVMGANGALGGGIAARLRASGAHVIGTARNAGSSSRLDAALDERLILDVEDDASIERLCEYLSATGVDGVVHAIGLVGFGGPSATDPADAERLMRVNHLGPARVITALLPALRVSATEGREPVVASITGVVAEQAFPGMSAYVASKSAHSAWLQALRLDLRRDRIRVLEARPGHTETGLAGRALFGTAPRFPQGLAPERVVEAVVDAIGGNVTDLASCDFVG